MEFGLTCFLVPDPSRKSARTSYDGSLQRVEPAEALGFAHVQTVEHCGSPYGGHGPGCAPAPA
ncbi:hypothetical protein [Streptomyces sp. NPDC002851]